MVPTPLVDPVDPSANQPHISGSATPGHTIYVYEDLVESGSLTSGDEWYEANLETKHQVGDGTTVPDHVRVLVGSTTAASDARWSVRFNRTMGAGELVRGLVKAKQGSTSSRAHRFFWTRNVDSSVPAVPTQTYFGDIYVAKS